MAKRLCKHSILFLIGGTAYCLLECLWRGHSHWTMFLLGGFLFILLGELNEGWLDWDTPLVLQGVIGSIMVTLAEFLAGAVLNLWLGLHVWDYSNVPFNVLGQICLPFSLLWVLVSMLAIVLDDWLRYWLFHEERPHYKLL